MSNSAFVTPAEWIPELTSNYINIPSKVLRKEARLYDHKWWDYRRLHPAHATQQFAKAYTQAVKLDITQRIDQEKGLHYKGLKHTKPDEIHQNGTRTVTGLWKSRQMADYLGMPYPFYCYCAIRYCADRHWHYIPRTWQLYSNKPDFNGISMVDYIRAQWDERSKTVRSPHDRFYTNDEWIAHPYQISWLAFLKSRIDNHPAKAMLLSELVYEKQFMQPGFAIKIYGKSVMKQAESLSASVA